MNEFPIFENLSVKDGTKVKFHYLAQTDHIILINQIASLSRQYLCRVLEKSSGNSFFVCLYYFT